MEAQSSTVISMKKSVALRKTVIKTQQKSIIINDTKI